MRIAIDAAGRLVVPKALRDDLGIRGPTELEAEARDGVIELAVGKVGIDGLPTWLEGPSVAMLSIMMLNVWTTTGTIMVIFLAIAGPLEWFSTYPDSLIGFLQSMVAPIPVAAVIQRPSRSGVAHPKSIT